MTHEVDLRDLRQAGRRAPARGLGDRRLGDVQRREPEGRSSGTGRSWIVPSRDGGSWRRIGAPITRQHLGERLREPIDLVPGPLLRDGDREHVVPASAERHASQEAVIDEPVANLGRRPRHRDGELLEERRRRVQQSHPVDLREPFGRVGGLRRALPAELGEPRRSEPPEVDRGGDGHQGLVRADVGVGLLAADVLLAGLERQDVAGLAVDVDGLADDAARHPADVVQPRRR